MHEKIKQHNTVLTFLQFSKYFYEDYRGCFERKRRAGKTQHNASRTYEKSFIKRSKNAKRFIIFQRSRHMKPFKHS